MKTTGSSVIELRELRFGASDLARFQPIAAVDHRTRHRPAPACCGEDRKTAVSDPAEAIPAYVAAADRLVAQAAPRHLPRGHRQEKPCSGSTGQSTGRERCVSPPTIRSAECGPSGSRRRDVPGHICVLFLASVLSPYGRPGDTCTPRRAQTGTSNACVSCTARNKRTH